MNEETKIQAQVRQTFENGAKTFDDIYRPSESKDFLSKWIDKTFRQSMTLRFYKTLELLERDDLKTILDVGCGSGRYCIEYLRMRKRVLGIDVSSNMIDLARAACESFDSNSDTEFLIGDYVYEPLDEKYDAAVLMGLFDYIENPQPLLIKLKNEVNTLILASFPKKFNKLNYIRKYRYKLKRCPLYYYTQEQLEDIFQRARFSSFEILDSDREYYAVIQA